MDNIGAPGPRQRSSSPTPPVLTTPSVSTRRLLAAHTIADLRKLTDEEIAETIPVISATAEAHEENTLRVSRGNRHSCCKSRNSFEDCTLVFYSHSLGWRGGPPPQDIRSIYTVPLFPSLALLELAYPSITTTVSCCVILF